MHRLGLIAAWLVVAALATALAWGVLSSADRVVGEAAATPVLGVDGPDPTALPADPDPTTTTPEVAGSSTAPAPATTSPPSTTPSTSSPAAPTSTTSAPASWAQKTVPSPGGVVVVGHRSHEVRLESATPAPGFTMEIDEQGPDEVRVEFENDDDSYEIRVRWEDGVLATEVD